MQDASRPGPDPVVEAYMKDIDRTLIRENLKLTVEEPFRKAMAVARFAEELRRDAAWHPIMDLHDRASARHHSRKAS
jgi:hypothetical protein